MFIMFIPQTCGKKQVLIPQSQIWIGLFRLSRHCEGCGTANLKHLLLWRCPWKIGKSIRKKMERKKKNVFFHIFDPCFLVLGFFVNWESNGINTLTMAGFHPIQFALLWHFFSAPCTSGTVACQWAHPVLAPDAPETFRHKMSCVFLGRHLEDAEIIQKWFHCDH